MKTRLKIDPMMMDTQQYRLQYNIWQTLEDILEKLEAIGNKPLVESENTGELHTCEKCGKPFEDKKKLAGHKIKCKGSG